MLAVLLALVACGSAQAASMGAGHFEDARSMFEEAGGPLDVAKREVDSWTKAQVAGVHEVVTQVLEEARADHEAEHLALLELEQQSQSDRAFGSVPGVDMDTETEKAGKSTISRSQSLVDAIEGDGQDADRAKRKLLKKGNRAASRKVSSLKFWRRLFNCARCEMDDGTVGIFNSDKMIGAAVNKAFDLDASKTAAAADMKIDRVYALEWLVFPTPDPVPNPMVTFICDPKVGNLLFQKDQVEEAMTEEPLDGDVLADISETVDDSREGGQTTAEDHGGEEPSRDGKKQMSLAEKFPLIRKIMSKIIAGMAKFGRKCVNAMKRIAQMLFTATRCAICVFCNLINIIVDLFIYIKKKASAAMNFIVNHGSKLVENIKHSYASWKDRRNVELQRRERRVVEAEAGKLGNLGDYCRTDGHCVSGRCDVSMVSRNQCDASKKQLEYREGGCNKPLKCRRKHECEKSGCTWKAPGVVSTVNGEVSLKHKVKGALKCKCSIPSGAQAPNPLRLDEGAAEPAPTPHSTALLETGTLGHRRLRRNQQGQKQQHLERVSDLALLRNDPKLAELEQRDMGHAHPVTGSLDHLTQEQKQNRAVYNLHSSGAFDDHDEFLDKHLFTHESAHKIFSGTVNMLQLSARAHESAMSRAAAKAMGIVKLPNRCVSNEKIGKTITIAINYENPGLIKCLIAMPFHLNQCMPELLIAIAPISVEGSSVAPECLAGSVAKEDAQGGSVTPESLDKAAVAALERRMAQDVPAGEVGDALREAL